MAATAAPASSAAAQTPAHQPLPERLYSLDVFRGLTMLWMISNGFGLRYFQDDPSLAWLARQFTHADWHGMFAWDLIQPFFMFIVGVAMPFAFHNRSRTTAQVIKRCGLLVMWGIVARSISAGKPNLDLINVLAQIAFTYFVAYLVLDKGWRVQALTAFALLAAHTLFYLFVSAPGVAGAWDKDANIGWWLDGAVLGKHWGGGYATINCVSSAANTIFGVMAGWLLFSSRDASSKIRTLAMFGAAALAAGLAMDFAIPNIKKIWTATFAIYSTGFTLLALALFYWLLDVKRWRKGTVIFGMIGANSIFIYLFHEILHRWLDQTGLVFTGWAIALWPNFGHMLNAWLVIAFQVYVCYWLYQRKIFFRV